MIKSIRYIILLLILFIGANVANTIGVDYKILLVIITSLSCLVIIVANSYKNRHEEILLILFIAVFTIYKMISDGSEGSRIIGFNVLVTPIVILAYPLFDRNLRKYANLRSAFVKILIMFFIAECSIAIFENITNIQLFIYDNTDDMSVFNTEIIDFRSIAIHGHPLQNALIVSTLMSFFCISNFKPFFKYSFWLIGYIAILSFNTRSSIVVCAILLLIYLLNILFSQRVNSRIKVLSLFFVFLCIGIGSYLLISGKLGGRILKMGLFDESSAQVRIDIWRIFEYYKLSDFAFGMNYKSQQHLFSSLGLVATENFWIDWILSYGFIFLLSIVTLYYFLFKKILKRYSLFNKIFVLTSFLLIASTNNSLSTSPIPLIIFLFSCILFNPLYSNRITIFNHKISE